MVLRAYNLTGYTAYFGREAVVETSANADSTIYTRSCSSNCNPDIIQAIRGGSGLTDNELTMISTNGKFLALERDSLLVANRLDSGDTCSIAGIAIKN